MQFREAAQLYKSVKKSQVEEGTLKMFISLCIIGDSFEWYCALFKTSN